MRLISSEDRRYLENKFHRTDEPFDAYRRWNYHGYEYDPATGLSDEEIQEKLAELSAGMREESHPVQKAKLFAFVLDNTRIDVNEHDYFIGIYTWSRPLDRYTIGPWYREVREAFPEANARLALADRSGTSYGGLDFDHTVPDWDGMMELGFPGLLRRIRDSHDRLEAEGKITPKKEQFYQGMVIEYEAMIRFLDRLYRYACEKTFAKAPRIARSLEHLRDGAPRDTFDAMQMIYIYFMVSESIEHYQVRSLGHGLDATLYPFFVRDIENGTFTREDIAEMLGYFLMQWSAIGNYWGQPFYLAGTNLDGTTRVNELTRLILSVYDQLGIYNPKIQIKVGASTPKDFLLQALEMIRGGNTSIVFCSEDHIVHALMYRGEVYEDAMDAVISGCYEYQVKAKGIGIGGNYPNPVKPVSLVFENGFDPVSGEQIGPETGSAETITSFEQFYSAYLTQLKYMLLTDYEALNQLMTRVAEVNPSLLFSGTIPDCVESLTDALDNGIANSCGMTIGGIGTAVDALMGVYELVYEKKLITLPELKTALEKNWEGYEKLRLRALNLKHKYGNGDRMADFYARAIYQFIGSEIIAGLRNSHGGHVGFEAHSARAFIINGEKTMATPDGRRYGEEIGKNASPTPGADRSGVTALIQSATSVNADLCTTGFCLDVMMHPTAVQGAEGLEALCSVLKTYMEKGGASVHFNIFNPEILRDAQAHPEKYRNLQVRVCGWNALWNDLPRSEQDAYIARAENIR